VVECIRLESEQTVKGLGSSNLPLSSMVPLRRNDSTSLQGIATLSMAAFVFLLMAPAFASSSGTISGRIVRIDTHTGIEDAIVTVLVRAGDRFINVVPDRRTRSDGSFSALGVSETDVVVSITAKDFEPLTCRYRLSPGGLLHVEFALERTIRDAPYSNAHASCPSAPSDGGHAETVYDVR
jgi:hypothetical protein